MSTITVSISETLGTDLSSRSTAATLRRRVVAELAGIGGDARAIFDFSGVRTVSGSFSDELFASLAEEHGAEWFQSHIGFANVQPWIAQSIVDAIEERLSPA